MPLSSWWTCGYITIHSTWSHQNAAGFLRYQFRHAANTTSNYGKQIVTDVDLGNTSGNFGMNDSYSFKNWGANGGTNNSGNAQDTHALEIRHLPSTGNGCYIVVEMYGSYAYNYAANMYMTVGHTY